jgi:hypothetical protein
LEAKIKSLINLAESLEKISCTYRSNIKEPNPGTLCASLDLEQKYKAATKIDRLTVTNQ